MIHPDNYAPLHREYQATMSKESWNDFEHFLRVKIERLRVERDALKKRVKALEQNTSKSVLRRINFQLGEME